MLLVLVAVGRTHLFLFLKIEAHAFNGLLSPGMLDIRDTCILPRKSCLLVTCLIVVTRTSKDSHLKMRGVSPSLGEGMAAEMWGAGHTVFSEQRQMFVFSCLCPWFRADPSHGVMLPTYRVARLSAKLYTDRQRCVSQVILNPVQLKIKTLAAGGLGRITAQQPRRYLTIQSKNEVPQPGRMAHTCNPTTQGTRAGGLLWVGS